MFKLSSIPLMVVLINLLLLQNVQAAPIEIRKDAIETSYRNGSSEWFEDGTELYTYWGNRWLEYQVELPIAGTWTIGLSATNLGQIPSSYSNFEITFYIDGVYINSFYVPASSSEYNEGGLDVENLSSGLHTFRFKWTNDYYSPPYDANI
ncbi:hypothetical protein KKB06_00465, partial [Patescibacteria group bacterium]|nr:hypothetical protein [Patescibacteria group bacterium]